MATNDPNQEVNVNDLTVTELSQQINTDVAKKRQEGIKSSNSKNRDTTISKSGVSVNQKIGTITGQDLFAQTENLGTDIRRQALQRQTTTGVTNETAVADIITSGGGSQRQVAAAQRAEAAATGRLQTGGTAPAAATTGIGGGRTSSGGRTIPCPTCTGNSPGGDKILVKTSGRLFSMISGLLQRSFSIRLPTNLLTYIKERLPVSKQIAYRECKTCNNTREIEDPSDDSDRYAQALAIAQAEAPNIEQNEALLDACGNCYQIYTGDTVISYGHPKGFRDNLSYRIDPCGAPLNKGICPDQIDETKAGYQVFGGGRGDHVQGLNNLSTPGGNLTTVVNNKRTDIVGVKGYELVTGGPYNLNTGQMTVAAPEVSIGAQGRVVLESSRNSVVLTGKSIEAAPTDPNGQFTVRGNISTPSNMIVGGHGHFEGASVVKLSTTGRNESTKVSSGSNIYGGPAFWGGPVPEGIIAGLREVASFATMSISHPEQIKTSLSLRRGLSLTESLLTLAYQLRTVEFVPTGIGLTLGILPTLIFNFPHIHATPDGTHTHDVRMPNIDFSADSAKELRKKFSNIGSNAPSPEFSVKAIDVLLEIFGLIFLPFQAVAAALQHFTFIK